MPESIILTLILKELVLTCTARDADTNVTDAAARARRGVVTRRRMVRSVHGATLIHEQPLSNHERDGEPIGTA